MGDYHFWVDHFIRASLLTKCIYALLTFLSITAWAIMIRKGRQLGRTDGTIRDQPGCAISRHGRNMINHR